MYKAYETRMKEIFAKNEIIGEMFYSDFLELKKLLINEKLEFSFINNMKLPDDLKTSKPDSKYHGFLICQPIYSDYILLSLKNTIFFNKIKIIKSEKEIIPDAIPTKIKRKGIFQLNIFRNIVTQM